SNKVDDRDIEVAADPGAQVTAFVATASELLVLGVGLDPDVPLHPTILGRCTLAPVQPVQLALVPGSDAQVFVADGAGDGVVVITKSSIPPPPPAGPSPACDTTHRISAGGRSVRSISLSPRWYQGNAGPALNTHVAGELLLMVVPPSTTVVPGQELDPGGLLFAWTGLGAGPECTQIPRPSPPGIVPIPPYALCDTTQEPMQPLSLPSPGFMREGAFLRAVQPRLAPVAPDL